MGETRVADRYEPLEIIGRGGEATVLKAVDTRHQRLVALKVRVVSPAGSPDDLLLEARALLSLPPHPGLAHARDDLFDQDRHVLVLDWVDGVNLARLLADEGGPGLPVSSVLRWIAQAAEALTVLHHHGVIHGDVKPANLILDRSGRVVLVDLGSSSVPRSAAPTGGTPGFRAPELAGGEQPDRASDVFSLAATAFTLLTGSQPTGALPAWHGVSPAVSGRLEAALRSGLAIDPARRPATPGELVERLRAGWDDRTPAGVATVLLTDVVDSTKLWEQVPQRVPAMLAEMQLVVDRNVEAHGGKRLGATVEGDATTSVFPDASSALRAAIAVQRGLSSRSGALGVRAGLATGEVLEVDGEVLGTTVNRAARVRDLARRGEILLAASTAVVVKAAPPPGVELLPLGAHMLKGLEGTDDVAAVVAEGVTAPPDPARSPYPGLASFDVGDADLFFGREDVVERCLELFRAHRFVAVVGASGSGKTSVALAGLAPRLGEVAVLRPGVRPAQSLRDAGIPGHDGAALIVDQFEELVTLCRDPLERAAFVDQILAHPGGLIVSVRADLYGELGAFPELADGLSSSHVLLGPLATNDLLRAVHEPAERCGLVIEEGLGEVIAAELGDAPGALPLLGHALREAWLRRDGRTITLAGYRASGGVRSAIATTADKALAALDAEDQLVARRVLLRMVELRPDGDDARRWASRLEVTEIAPDRGREVVSALTASRLLVVDREQVTVVHEALLRAWPQFREWIADARSDLLARQEVRWAAERWAAGGRSDADLYRGTRVDPAVELAAREALPAQEAAFVDASRQLRDRELAEQRRRTRRLRVLATVTSVLALVALVVGAIAVIQRNDAQEAREDADAAAREAQIEALVGRTESIRATQRDVAALLAVEAFRLADTPRTRSALLSTFTSSEGFLDAHRIADDDDGGANGIVLPDGRSAYLVDRDGRLRPYDLDAGTLGDPFTALGPPHRFSPLATTADGALIAQTAWDNLDPVDVTTTVGVFDTTTGALRFDPVVVDGGVNAVAFTPDASTLVLTVQRLEGPSGVRFLDAATGAPVATSNELSVEDAILSGLAVVGDELVVGSSDGTVRVLDGETLALERSFAMAPGTASFVSAAGEGTIITTGEAGQQRIDVSTGETVWNRSGETCRNVTVTAERGKLYCGDLFGRLIEQDLATGLTLRRLDVQNGNSGPLWPADGGAELVSFGDNEPVVSRWRLDGAGPITHLVAPGWDALGFSPDGARLLVDRGETEESYAAQVVDSATGGVVADLGPMVAPGWTDDDTIGGVIVTDAGTVELAHIDLEGGGIIADGFVVDPVPDEAQADPGKARMLLRYVAGSDMSVEASDIAAFDAAAQTFGPRITVERLVSMAITRSGDRIAVGTGNGVLIFDAVTGDEVGQIPGGDLRGAYITITDQLFVSSLGGELTHYDIDTLEPIRSFGGSRGYMQQVSGTTDGAIIATKGGDRSVTLFDVASGVRLGTPIMIPDDVFNSISLDSRGTRLAVTGSDGVQIWDLDPDRWAEAACEIAGRNLTREEWATNVGELAPYRATCPQFPLGA